jgi:hypothetical protein
MINIKSVIKRGDVSGRLLSICKMYGFVTYEDLFAVDEVVLLTYKRLGRRTMTEIVGLKEVVDTPGYPTPKDLDDMQKNIESLKFDKLEEKIDMINLKLNKLLEALNE